MIKASALLAAVAIGLLVAGVLASSLLMVYVSIGVCAVAALILAVGIVTHWSEIFGRGEARPASAQGAWSAPQAEASSPAVLAGAVSTAVASGQERPARHEEAGGPPAGEQAEAIGSREQSPVAGRSDDLWERVEEELGSAGKRDTGALSWPAIELPVFRESPGSPEQAAPSGKTGPGDTSAAGPGAWMWGQGAGWQPPETSDPAWPPPAAAFARSSARPEPAQDADDTGLDGAGPDGAGPDDTRPDDTARDDTRADDTRSAHAEPAAAEEAEAASAAPAQDADASPGSPGHDATPGAPDDTGGPGAQEEEESAGPDSSATPPGADTGRDRPQWIIPLPGREDPPEEEPASDAAENDTEVPDSGTPGQQPPAGQQLSAQDPAAGNPAAGEPAAGESAAGDSAAGEPAADGPSAGGSAAPKPREPAAAEPAAGPGRVEVSVVPGVARYHRSGCILIRFLGADDLEIMTRQEAEEATFVPCRACQPDQLEA